MLQKTPFQVNKYLLLNQNDKEKHSYRRCPSIPVLLLCIKEIDWAVSALLSLSCLLCSTFLAVTAGESRQRCSAVSQWAGVKKSTGRVVDRKNKRAKGRKLKRGQRLRKGGQQWAQQRDSPVRLLWLQLLLNLTHMQGDARTHTHTQWGLLIKFSCSAVAIHSQLQAQGGSNMKTCSLFNPNTASWSKSKQQHGRSAQKTSSG